MHQIKYLKYEQKIGSIMRTKDITQTEKLNLKL